MDFLTLAKKRYSVRAYTKQKVEKEKLDAILEAAHVAPTGGNCQPQHLIVVQSDEGLSKIGKATNIYGAPLAIIVCSDTNKVWTRPFDGKKRAFTSESDPTGFYCQTFYKGENPEQEKRAIARCYRATG